jgi:hypothetical protein
VTTTGDPVPLGKTVRTIGDEPGAPGTVEPVPTVTVSTDPDCGEDVVPVGVYVTTTGDPVPLGIMVTTTGEGLGIPEAVELPPMVSTGVSAP